MLMKKCPLTVYYVSPLMYVLFIGLTIYKVT